MTYFYTVRFLFTYFFIALILSTSYTFAQTQDSTQMSKGEKKAIYSSARKATLMSACLPGLGQIYNKKYWKAPVIYVALGGLSYWGISNHNKYSYYSKNLRAENDEDASTINDSKYSSDQLITQKRYYRKFRDIAIMAGALVYLVNIIDANVDAHLKTFDVSDDLSLQIKPYSAIGYNNKLQTGLTLNFTFK